MGPLHALILGIVEGITEFLPVSSTGHLIVASSLLRIPEFTDESYLKTFEITIQLGAILSVIVLYAKRLIVEPKVILKVITAFIPTALIGFALYKVIKSMLIGNTDVVLWSLFIGGIIFILFEQFHRESPHAVIELKNISYRHAIMIGIAQALAVIPGISRSGATIIGGMSLGISRKTIVEFSFLLAVPTILAATGYDLIKTAPVFTGDMIGVLAIGIVTSFLVALVCIRYFLRYIQNNTFTAFGIYRILAAGLFWLLLY